MFGWALIVLFILGAVVLELSPPTPLDEACLSKPLAEIGRCIADHTK
jgi:hypothetical protein